MLYYQITAHTYIKLDMYFGVTVYLSICSIYVHAQCFLKKFIIYLPYILYLYLQVCTSLRRETDAKYKQHLLRQAIVINLGFKNVQQM